MALFLLQNMLYFIAPGCGDFELPDFELPFVHHVTADLRVQMVQSPSG